MERRGSVACIGDECLLCYANRRGRSHYKGHRFYVTRQRRVRKWYMPLKKPSGFSGSGSTTLLQTSPGKWEKVYPLLAEFLSACTWEDGGSREPGTLLLFAEDGTWKGCLHDRTASMQTFCSALTPDGLLEALEKGLRADSLDWRRKKPWGQPGAKKRG